MRIVFLFSYRRIINTEVFFFQEAFAAPNTSVIIQKQRTLLITFNQTMLDDKLKLVGKMAEERTQRKKNHFFKFLQNVYSILDLEFTKSIIISTLPWCSLQTANARPEMRLLARPEIRLLFVGYPRCGDELRPTSMKNTSPFIESPECTTNECFITCRLPAGLRSISFPF